MEKFIPYEKLSKKEQQKINKAKRGTWGELNPVTRKPQNSKTYNRRPAFFLYGFLVDFFPLLQ